MKIVAMASFQQTFAPGSVSNASLSENNTISDSTEIWTSVAKKSQKSQKQFKGFTSSIDIIKPSIDIIKPTDTAESAERSGKTGPRKPPSGIFVNLGKDWKDFVRKLVPNEQRGNSIVRDNSILDEIAKLKRNPSVSNFEFKKIVCLIFHQAIKTDRHSLIESIIKQWNAAKYNIIELIDSTYDSCKPMTQACWSGSLFCIRTIISADPSGQILSTVHPTKGETILETLMAGKSYALKKDPTSALFIAERFDKCERFIRDAQRGLAEKESDSNAKSEIDQSVREEIEDTKLLSSDLVSDLSLKLVDLYLSDQTVANKYFNAARVLVDKEIFEQININLQNEGFEFS